MKRIYMDYAATTPTHPEVAEAMKPYLSEKFGNPSSIHSFGREAKKAVDDARDSIAASIGARPDEIIFTSGGTEADNFALEGVAYANEKKGNHIISTPVEHHAVINCLGFLKKRGFEITYVPVDSTGLVDPEDIRKAITDKTILVSVMHANNEMGTIEPIAEIGSICREKGVYFHTDAVQTFGHMPLDMKKLNVDLLSASAHKLYGPKGVGMLYVKKGTKIVPYLHGGEQEMGKRASTENVPGIVGFAKAVELVNGSDSGSADERIRQLRDKLIKGILSNIKDSRLNGHPTKRLSNNVNVSIKYIEGESMLLRLDMEGIAASTGSACSSGSLEPSHVLLSIGLPPEIAHSSLRLTLGKWTTQEEVDKVLEVLPKIVAKLREISPLKRE
ncbi:MAG: cysteine desulfurase NifS [bacterium]